MYNTTPRLENLMIKYNISAYQHGAREDKIGDVFEDYCVEVLNSSDLLHKYLTNSLDLNDTDEFIFKLLLDNDVIPNKSNILRIVATNKIEHRITGGNPKTDVIADVMYDNDNVIHIPISVKHTTARKVAMAEFDVATIQREVGITDERLIYLMTKHQVDASAKNFTAEERNELTDRLQPYSVDFVRWVLTGSVEKNSTDLRFPKLILKINFTKKDEIENIHVYNIDEYIDSVMKDSNGKIRKGGFGTGLSWTYATGSKGKKIQFKG